MNYAVLLAGGAGSRFWPLSRYSEPKQFIRVCSAKPLIEESIMRVLDVVSPDKIHIATGKAHSQKIATCFKAFKIAKENIFLEPEAKSTLAPIAILAKRIYEKDKDAVIIIFPSDHYVKGKSKFLKTLRKCIRVAKEGHIVTLGVVPKRPETGYGYIKVKTQGTGHMVQAYKVERYIEKPDIKRAKEFIKDRLYYWNSGIFIFKAEVILREIQRLAPTVHKIIMRINSQKELRKLWPTLPSLSIDYAVMEKTNKTMLVPATFEWIDVGNWQSIDELARKDRDGNIFKCDKHVDIDSKNTLVWSAHRLVATIGLEDLLIVDTKDALLVCKKDRSQDVRTVVSMLKKKKYGEYT